MTDPHPKTGQILVVDDTPQNVQLVRAQLERAGHHVTSATTGEAGLAAAEREPPDLILLDVLMPGIDGYEVCRRMKGAPATRAVPVIMLTALREQADKLRALEAGADDFLSKPVDRLELLARVRAHLRSKFLYDALARSRNEVTSLNEALERRVAERTQQLEAALARLRDAQAHVVQQERLLALGEMASGVAHDLNNALSPVVGFSELLLNDPAVLDDRARLLDHLHLIYDGAQSAAAVVSRLRQFYRPREAHEPLGKVNVHALFEQAVAFTQPKWRDQALAAGKTIRVEADLSPLPDVAGDTNELRDLLTNLLFNAVDAIPSGTPAGAITLRAYLAPDGDEGVAVLEVSDTGTGMTQEVRRRCLEPFFTTKGEHGTGLGLSVVHGIIRRHGGAIEIQSQPGQGTTFRIRLPVAGRPAPLPSPSEEAPEERVAADVPGARPPAGLRILVVDDQPVLRQVMEAYLEADGHRVITAASGGKALDLLLTEPIDVVLTDWAMPGMGGDQLAAAIKQRAPNLPVVLVTGFGDLVNAADEQVPGADAIVGKPVTLDKLRRALARVALPRHTTSDV